MFGTEKLTVKPRLHDTTGLTTGCIHDTAVCQTGCQMGLSYVKLACHQQLSRVKPRQNFVLLLCCFVPYRPNFVPRPLWEILTYAMCTPWYSFGSKCSQGIFTDLKHREFCAAYLWPPCVADADIIFLPCYFFLSSFFISDLISAAADWMSNILPHMAWPCANLECRSEMCCTRLAGNTGRKNNAKNRHLRTIAQLRRVISSQLRHVSTIGKKRVKQQYLL